MEGKRRYYIPVLEKIKVDLFLTKVTVIVLFTLFIQYMTHQNSHHRAFITSLTPEPEIKDPPQEEEVEEEEQEE